MATLVLADRMREVNLGQKTAMIEEYATWCYDGRGEAQVRTFDTLAEAELDFEAREPALQR